MSDNFLKDFEWETYETLKSQYVKLYDEYMKLKTRLNEQYGISYFIHKQIIKDYISKDKIREKIKEYQNKLFQDIEENKVVEYENILQLLNDLLNEDGDDNVK